MGAMSDIAADLTRLGIDPSTVRSSPAELEEWRPAPGFSDYEVSSEGRLRRIRSRRKVGLGLPLAQRERGRGYLSYVFRQHGKRKTKEIHPLVCEAFHGPRPTPRHDAAHWDGVRTNNRAANLRWATRAANMADMVRHGKTTQGARSPAAKLTDVDVLAIRSAYAELKTGRYCSPSPVVVLAERFGVCPSTIYRVATGQRWRHVNGR